MKKDRLYGIDKYLIGLTGGIATGKSSASKFLKEAGHPVIDADSLVKEIYQTQEAKDFINSIYPSAITDNTIHFPILRKAFFSNKTLKQKIEAFIYQRLEKLFLEKVKSIKEDYLIYDIPLLFEKKLQDYFDKIIVVSTAPEYQLERLISRDKTSIDEAKKIINSQIKITEKNEKADYIIENNKPLENLKKRTQEVIALILIDKTI